MEAGNLVPCLHVAISYTDMPIQSGIMPDNNLMHEWGTPPTPALTRPSHLGERAASEVFSKDNPSCNVSLCVSGMTRSSSTHLQSATYWTTPTRTLAVHDSVVRIIAASKTDFRHRILFMAVTLITLGPHLN